MYILENDKYVYNPNHTGNGFNAKYVENYIIKDIVYEDEKTTITFYGMYIVSDIGPDIFFNNKGYNEENYDLDGNSISDEDMFEKIYNDDKNILLEFEYTFDENNCLIDFSQKS